MKSMYIFIIALIFLTSLNSFSQEKENSLIDNPPKLSEYVTDETGTLTQEQIAYLRKKLRKFYDSTSTQILVYMVNTLNGEPIDEAANSIARKNKIGKKDKNNGLLLLIAKNDRKLRIEVGYGLEGAITDALSMQIIRKEISPDFKNGNYYGGIVRGLDAIISAANGEYTAEENKVETNNYSKPGSDIWIYLILLGIPGIIFFIMIIAIFNAVRKNHSIGGSGGYYISGSSSSSSWSSSSDSSSSSSSSSDDSSFSGGGGDFGGGGASGDW